jgi:hypothetical protein
MLDVAVPAAKPLCMEHIGWHRHPIDKAIINPHLLLNMNDKIRTMGTMLHHNNINNIHHVLRVLLVCTVDSKRVESSYNNPRLLIMAENKYMRRLRAHHQPLRNKFAQRTAWYRAEDLVMGT